MEQLSFTEFINWIIFGGGAVLASSFLLERWPWFQTLESGRRQLISYISASSLGIGAYALITYAPDFIVAAQPFFLILGSTFVSIFVSNTFHSSDKKELADSPKE